MSRQDRRTGAHRFRREWHGPRPTSSTTSRILRVAGVAIAIALCLAARADGAIASLVPQLPLELVPVALVRPRLLPRRSLSRYLVGWDVAPGCYRLTAVDGAAYFARRDVGGEIIDNGFSASALTITVDPGDWMLQFRGELTPA